VSILPLEPLLIDADSRHVSLSIVAAKVGGEWLRVWVCINAFAILAAAVLSGYAGTVGLLRRMAVDRCLPSFLLKKNTCWYAPSHIVRVILIIMRCRYDT
jgi:amino acid transporter